MRKGGAKNAKVKSVTSGSGPKLLISAFLSMLFLLQQIHIPCVCDINSFIIVLT